MSSAKVSPPTTIQGSRQIATATRGPPGAGGAAHSERAAGSQSGTSQPRALSNRRSIESNASSTDLIRVTQTAMPASRRRRTSSSRFSSWLATTRSGARAMIARTSGFLVPRTRMTSRSAGCGAPVGGGDHGVPSAATSASVSDGTRLTTRRAGCDTATTCPRSSTASGCCIPGGYRQPTCRAVSCCPAQGAGGVNVSPFGRRRNVIMHIIGVMPCSGPHVGGQVLAGQGGAAGDQFGRASR